MHINDIVELTESTVDHKDSYLCNGFLGVCLPDLACPRSLELLDLPIAETGKWITYDTDRYPHLLRAFVDEQFYAEMKTGMAPDENGHPILVYCPVSAMAQTAQCMRELGVSGRLYYKPDRATVARVHGMSGISHIATIEGVPIPNPDYALASNR